MAKEFRKRLERKPEEGNIEVFYLNAKSERGKEEIVEETRFVDGVVTVMLVVDGIRLAEKVGKEARGMKH